MSHIAAHAHQRTARTARGKSNKVGAEWHSSAERRPARPPPPPRGFDEEELAQLTITLHPGSVIVRVRAPPRLAGRVRTTMAGGGRGASVCGYRAHVSREEMVQSRGRAAGGSRGAARHRELLEPQLGPRSTSGTPDLTPDRPEFDRR